MSKKLTVTVGEVVVYKKQKVSTKPGPRAKDVHPAATGDTYSYLVDKYWLVTSVLDDGSIELTTKRGKTHVVKDDDPRLRHLTFFEKLFSKKRFPTANEPA